MRGRLCFLARRRGKYARRYGQGANVVALADDVAKVLPNSPVANGPFQTRTLSALSGFGNGYCLIEFPSLAVRRS